MARVKIKVENRLMRLISDMRAMHAAEHDPVVRQALAKLIQEQGALLEWVNLNFSTGKDVVANIMQGEPLADANRILARCDDTDTF